jgi:hypothetical protein
MSRSRPDLGLCRLTGENRAKYRCVSATLARKPSTNARKNAVFDCAKRAVRASLYGTAGNKRWGLSDGARKAWHRSRVKRSGAFKRYSKHKGMSHVEDPDHYCDIDRDVERCRRR